MNPCLCQLASPGRPKLKSMLETRPLCLGQSFQSGRLAGTVRTFPPGWPPCPKLSVRALPPEPNPQDSLGMVVPRGVNSAGLPCRCWLYLCARGAGVGFRCMRVAGKTVCAFGVSCTQKKVDFCVLSKLSVPLGPRAPYSVLSCPELSVPPLPSTPCCPMDCPYLQNRCFEHRDTALAMCAAAGTL